MGLILLNWIWQFFKNYALSAGIEAEQYVPATFIMEDDNGLLVDAYNTTELGEKDCTCICVMDRFRFTKWLGERQDRLETISDFC